MTVEVCLLCASLPRENEEMYYVQCIWCGEICGLFQVRDENVFQFSSSKRYFAGERKWGYHLRGQLSLSLKRAHSKLENQWSFSAAIEWWLRALVDLVIFFAVLIILKWILSKRRNDLQQLNKEEAIMGTFWPVMVLQVKDHFSPFKTWFADLYSESSEHEQLFSMTPTFQIIYPWDNPEVVFL